LRRYTAKPIAAITSKTAEKPSNFLVRDLIIGDDQNLFAETLNHPSEYVAGAQTKFRTFG
jgi:hypothetical protein